MYEYILVADISNIFILLREMYDSGSDPIKILQELLEITHWLTCKKIVSSETIELPFSSSDEERATSISNSLSIPKLTMLWQFFLKGLNETKIAPIPIQSLEMVLIRVSYISDNLPPEDIIESLKKKNQLIHHNQKKLDISNRQELDIENNKNKDEALEGERKKIFKSISDIMSFCLDKKEVKLAGEIKHYLELISFSQGKIEIASSSKIPDDFSSRLNSFLLNETGERWTVTSLNQEGENSLYMQEINLISSDPSVELILNTFPGSKVSKIEKVNLINK
jgi:DNA polymerase-3 subunit gamma/tau